jgi:nitrite reductase (NO-forming)
VTIPRRDASAALSSGPAASRPPVTGTRPKRRSRLRDYPAVLWLVTAVVVAFVHRQVPGAEWLLVHLVLLGALSHSILVWSFYFAQAILRVPVDETATGHQNARVMLMFAGTLAVLIGYPAQWWWFVLAGATLVAVAVLWHGITLWRLLRRALTARFRITIRYYLAATAWLAVGATGGILLAQDPADPWHGQLLLAHTMANLLGWVGMTVTGTLITFWPTLLRTRMDDRAARLATQALPVLTVGLAVLVTGALVGDRVLALTALGVYALGLLWWARALVRPLWTRPPREFAAASVGCALAWGVIGILGVGYLLATGGWDDLSDGYSTVAGIFAVGFAAQLLFGALSYLVPTVLGGGPRAVRAAVGRFNTWTTARIVLVNGGLVLYLLPTPSWVKVIISAVVVLALAVFIPLMFRAIKASIAVRRREAGQVPERPAAGTGTPAAEPSVWSGGQLIAALAILSVAVSVGVGLDPTAAGLPTTTAAGTTAGQRGGSADQVVPTGETVRIDVSARGMRFYPATVTVAPGDRLVLEVTNEDPSTTHDLRVGDASTPRLAPGEGAELDLGVVTGPLDGRCTVAGHAAQGMVFVVQVEGTGADDDGPGAHDGMAAAGGDWPVPFIPPRTDAELGGTVDPVLPSLGEETVHELTLTVTEEPLEVSPGQWQTRWTFNGGSVGPTLHGRVGDVFEITLVNDGTIGHSIDFHAGALAPDRPMRTIQPGESLVYRFTAERSGAWLYHCATMPMSTHIAAGMHGAVVIEPEGLPEVDRQYVLTQSDVYLANDAGGPDQAQELDGAKVAAQVPDRVVFNGIANQYDQEPFTARVGERVRFWVVNAGPNRPSSFHVVGGQFDTTYLEGAYLLDRGTDAFGHQGNGAQALALQPAQGGFVELVFPEAGHYPVVDHVMSDAEKGAHGAVKVSP